MASMEIREEVRQAWAKRRQRTLTVQVREELERMILWGEIKGGARLNENALAARMGVSRGPIREAARALERDGLVRTIANRGSFVRELSTREACELYDLRALLAGELCAQAARDPHPEAISDLTRLVAEMDAAIADADEDSYFARNLDFHDLIAEASGATRTRDLYLSLGKEVRLIRWHVLRGRKALEVSNAEHHRILAAIAARDPDAARREGDTHHRNGKRRWLETL